MKSYSFDVVADIPKDWHAPSEQRGSSKQKLKPVRTVPEHIRVLRQTLAFYTPEQVGELLRCGSESPCNITIYKWLKTERLKSQRIGRLYKITSYQLADFLEAEQIRNGYSS